jgi:NADH-ubiquinone oxidoreductase chain 4
LVVILIELTPQITIITPLGFSMSLALLALILRAAFSAISPLFFYIIFEASLIPIRVIILGWGYQPERLSAVMAIMLYTMLASLPLLLVLFFLSNAGQGGFCLNTEISLTSSSSTTAFTACAFLAFLVKLPMFAVHLWLPKAHVEAPVGGSMFLAALLLKLGGFGI